MSVATRAGTARGQLAGMWRQPLYRTGYLLAVNSALTAAMGLAYWLLAARLYPPAVVGANAAAVSAMSFLAGLAQLNLMSALLRFVPDTPPLAQRMIGGAFGLAAALSAVAAVIFLVGLPVWSPGLTGLLAAPGMRVAFVVVTAAWAVFVLQSSALVAVGRAAAVPAVNVGFAVLKAVLVVVLVWVLTRSGIWLSWAAAATLTAGVTLWYLHARAIPTFAAGAAPGGPPPTARDLAGYIGPDYLGSLAWTAATTLSPLLVFDMAGSRRGAVFSLVWSIGLALYLVASAFGQSLVAHGDRDPTRVEAHYRQALRQALLLLTPVVLVLIVAAPVLLAPFGHWYATHGATVLQLAAASALPNAVQTLQVARARVTRDMRMVATMLIVLCVLVLGLTALLVPRFGLPGAGIAWLVGQAVTAAGADVWHRRQSRPTAQSRPARDPASRR